MPSDLEPVQTDATRVVTVGTVLWLAALVVQLPFRGRLVAAGHGWWLWTCLAGVALGLLGIAYCRRRAAAGRAHQQS